MKQIISNLLSSFNSQEGGYSGKKLSALAVMMCVVAAQVKWMAMGDFKQLEMVLTINFTFISTMFGIGAYTKIKKDVPA
jgi:hypothetical protein